MLVVKKTFEDIYILKIVTTTITIRLSNFQTQLNQVRTIRQLICVFFYTFESESYMSIQMHNTSKNTSNVIK